MEKLLNKLRACQDAKDWAKGKDWKTIYETCERGDWLLWLFYRVNPGDKRIFLAKAHCANTVRHLMKNERSIKAIEAAIKFANGEITEEERKTAASAAYAVYSAYAAASAAAASATSAAAYAAASATADSATATYAYAYACAAASTAASATSAAAYAAASATADSATATYAYACAAASTAAASADSAAHAASATSASAYAYAAASTARKKNQKETADICRKYLPFEIWNIKS